MTCKDCIHNEACQNQVPRTFWDSETFYDGCKYFKDKSLFIELPCKVGDKVYELTTSEEIEQRKVKDIIYDNEGFRLRLEPYFSYEYYLNETVFLTHSEAAQALKERITNHRK